MSYAARSRLIVVDGISGSGKTTTCRWLTQILRQQHLPVATVYEEDVPHPLHWWDYWDGAQHRGPDFEHVPPATYMAASLARWAQFLRALQASDTVVVVEGVLFCLAAGFFVQGDAPRAELLAYYRQLDVLLAPAAPQVIYLRQHALASHTRRVWDERDPAMAQELIYNLERTPYLRSRQLRGFAGVIALWEDTQQLTDILVATSTLPTLTCEVTQGDWADHYQQIQQAVLRSS